MSRLTLGLYRVRADDRSYFFTLVEMQWGNLLASRTRRLSLFQANPFSEKNKNLWILPAMLAALAFVFFFSYVPFFQNAFLTRVSLRTLRLWIHVLIGIGGAGRIHLLTVLLRTGSAVPRRRQEVPRQEKSKRLPRQDCLVIDGGLDPYQYVRMYDLYHSLGSWNGGPRLLNTLQISERQEGELSERD